MAREISAGGVVVRHDDDGTNKKAWMLAVIEPHREPSAAKSGTILALPKGLVDAGEKPEEAALREVKEETGLAATPVTKLADIKYVYVRTWGDGARVFKIVSFYLLKYQSGDIDDISEEMRIEVKRAFWIPLRDAEKSLAYRGEKDVARRALEYIKLHPEV
jgi:8-oxo-dGTP pyrophosphatase MutT (NUDIX family)